MTAKEKDQFFTKPEIARECVNIVKSFVDIPNALWLDPCAGAGAFYDAFPTDNKVGMDLDPKRKEFKQQDFMSFEPKFKEPVITVTNPPFGSYSKDAFIFLTDSMQFSEVVGMLLPSSFDNYAQQRRLPEEWKLNFNQWVTPNAFTLEGKDYPLRCTFQVWAKTGANLRYTEFFPRKNTDKVQLVLDGGVATGEQRKVSHRILDYDYAVPWWACNRETLTRQEAQSLKVCTNYFLVKSNLDLKKLHASINIEDAACFGQSNAPCVRWMDYAAVLDGKKFNRIGDK